MQEGMVLLNSCQQPLSRGSVRLQSFHIRDDPLIDPNYFEQHEDIDCTIRAIRLAIDLVATKPFRAMDATIHWPRFEQCRNFFGFDDSISIISDQYLECIIRVASVTSHHSGGTCAIGKTTNSVLDSTMKVRGVKMMRVVDASAIPCN